jgi:hypothetical protein
MRQPGEEQAGGQHLGEQHRGAGVELRQPAAGMRRDQAPDPDRAGEENHRLGDDAADLADTDRTGLHQARHHGQDHQPQHVVDHRRAEHDARRRRIELAQVAEDPAGNADRGRRQRGAEEQIGVAGKPRQQPRPDHPGAQHEGHDDAHRADGKGARSDLDQVGQPRLQADLQQQHDDAKLGDEGDDRVLGDGLEAVEAQQRQIAQQPRRAAVRPAPRESRCAAPAARTGGRSSGSAPATAG